MHSKIMSILEKLAISTHFSSAIQDSIQNLPVTIQKAFKNRDSLALRKNITNEGFADKTTIFKLPQE